MPRINLSSRRAQFVQPQIDVTGPARETSAMYRELARVPSEVARSIGVVNQIKENDARHAVGEWQRQMMGAINGYITKDAAGNDVQVKGMAQKTFADYPDGESPLTDLAKAEEAFRNSATYLNMDTLTRNKFERMMGIPRAEIQRTVSGLYDRNAAAKDKFQDDLDLSTEDDKLATNFYGDDATFEAALESMATAKAGIRTKRLNMALPEAKVAYGKIYAEEVEKGRLGRVKALIQRGAIADNMIVGGKLVTANEDLARAEGYVNDLLKSGHIDEKTAVGFKYDLLQARNAYEAKLQGEVKSLTDNAVLSAYDEGGLEGLEGARAMLIAAIPQMRENSAVRAATLAKAIELDKAADNLVSVRMLNSLESGEGLLMADPNGEPIKDEEGNVISIFAPGTREAKVFPSVYKAFTEKQKKAFDKGYQEAHQQNMIAMRGLMMEAAASQNPTGFYNFLVDQLMNKKVSYSDYISLKKEFDEGWMNGFKDNPTQRSVQSELANDMLKSLNTKLGVDFSSALKTDDAGRPLIKNGAFVFDEKKELPAATVRRATGYVAEAYSKNGGAFSYHLGHTTYKKTEIDGAKIKEILVKALELWSANGTTVSYDPVTGKALENGKTHTVNAKVDFDAFLDRLVDENNVLSAADVLQERAAYTMNVRNQLNADTQRRTKAIADSNPR